MHEQPTVQKNPIDLSNEETINNAKLSNDIEKIKLDLHECRTNNEHLQQKIERLVEKNRVFEEQTVNFEKLKRELDDCTGINKKLQKQIDGLVEENRSLGLVCLDLNKKIENIPFFEEQVVALQKQIVDIVSIDDSSKPSSGKTSTAVSSQLPSKNTEAVVSKVNTQKRKRKPDSKETVTSNENGAKKPRTKYMSNDHWKDEFQFYCDKRKKETKSDTMTYEMIESQKILDEYMTTRPLLKGKTGTTIQKRFKKLLALELV